MKGRTSRARCNVAGGVSVRGIARRGGGARVDPHIRRRAPERQVVAACGGIVAGTRACDPRVSALQVCVCRDMLDDVCLTAREGGPVGSDSLCECACLSWGMSCGRSVVRSAMTVCVCVHLCVCPWHKLEVPANHDAAGRTTSPYGATSCGTRYLRSTALPSCASTCGGPGRPTGT